MAVVCSLNDWHSQCFGMCLMLYGLFPFLPGVFGDRFKLHPHQHISEVFWAALDHKSHKWWPNEAPLIHPSRFSWHSWTQDLTVSTCFQKSTHQTILGDTSSLRVMLPQRSQCLCTTPCRATAYLRDTIHFLTRLQGLGTLNSACDPWCEVSLHQHPAHWWHWGLLSGFEHQSTFPVEDLIKLNRLVY